MSISDFFYSDSLQSSSVLTVVTALFFAVMAAIAIFVCLRHVDTKRKLLCYFIGVAVYAIPTLFLLTDITALFSAILPEESGLSVPPVIGGLAAIATGVAFLGTVALVCSGRVMKSSGQIVIFMNTLVFFGAETVLTYFSLIAFTGSDTAQNLGGAFPGLAGFAVGKVSVSAAAAVLALLFTLCFFLCFLFNKSKKELKTEDIVKLHLIKQESARIEKEGVCAVCRYADCTPGSRGSVICEKKGRVARDGRCPKFEYDPLKRVPEIKDNDGAEE